MKQHEIFDRAHACHRLDQGPFGIEQDEGWLLLATTTPYKGHLRNPGLGLVGYAWEENGPSLKARQGQQSLEDHIDRLSGLPFTDVLYIRCDWRDVQKKPGRLDLPPVWRYSLEAAKARGQRLGFRIQLSSPNIQPGRFSLPDFLQEKVPMVNIGLAGGEVSTSGFDFYEPQYHHPEFMRAFRELNELLAAEFDGNDQIEFMDLMMYGFWGEGHTQNWPNPFPDYPTAEKTTREMTRIQLETWKRTPLVVNTQTDISNAGNRAVQEMAIAAGCWLRSDSILVEEPIQVEMLSERPPWLAAVIEDGYYRWYDTDHPSFHIDESGIGIIEKGMLHALDAGANYWSLWTEADNLKRYHERYPDGLKSLQERMGYRIRPSWIWQRKRHGRNELVVAIANDGVAGVPGVLWLSVEDQEGRVLAEGCLDRGHPFGGRLRQAAFLLPEGTGGGIVHLRATLEIMPGQRRPVYWACAQPLERGLFPIRLAEAEDPGWRKGL